MGTWFSKEPLKVIVLGLDSAGKTTLTTKIIGEAEDKNPLPTIGFQIKDFTRRGLSTKLWDLGGQERTRQIWGQYVLRCHMLVYIIDLQDVDRFALSFAELEKILSKYPVTFSTAPVIIFGNKLDTGVSEDVKNKFKKECVRITKNHWDLTLQNKHQNPFAFLTGSAKTGEGLDVLSEAIIYELEELHTGYFWRVFRNWVL